MMDLVATSSFFKTIGDPLRLRILHLLQREELTVGELVRVLELPQSTISRHLKPLREQGLLNDRPAGASTYYRADLTHGTNNGDSALREAIAEWMRESPMPAADMERLDHVLALRAAAGDEFFERIGYRWDALREDCHGRSFHLEAMLRLLPEEWTVADLGVGTGYFLPALSAAFRRVLALDRSKPMLDLAERRVRELGLDNVELRQGDLEAIPAEDGGTDLVLCILILHHLGDIDAGCREVARILRPGGRALIIEVDEHENERYRAAMGDPIMGLAPEALTAALAGAGLTAEEPWPIDTRAPSEHELAPIPKLYGMTVTRS